MKKLAKCGYKTSLLEEYSSDLFQNCLLQIFSFIIFILKIWMNNKFNESIKKMNFFIVILSSLMNFAAFSITYNKTLLSWLKWLPKKQKNSTFCLCDEKTLIFFWVRICVGLRNAGEIKFIFPSLIIVDSVMTFVIESLWIQVYVN